MIELTTVSLSFFDENGTNQPDLLSFLPSQRFSHFIELFESDEGKNGGIISVDSCKRGVVRGEILALAAVVKIDDAFPNRGRI